MAERPRLPYKWMGLSRITRLALKGPEVPEDSDHVSEKPLDQRLVCTWGKKYFVMFLPIEYK